MSNLLSNISEFNNLTRLAGINLPPAVVRIICELLSMQVAPDDIYKLLKIICPSSPKKNEAREVLQNPRRF